MKAPILTLLVLGFVVSTPARAGDAPPLSDQGIAEAVDAVEAAETRPDAPVRVSAHVESADVIPGRPFDLWVEVDRRADASFTLPDLGPRIEGLVVIDDDVGKGEHTGDRFVTRHRWTLKAPVSGTYLIPGIEAPWTTPDGQVGTAGSGPILVEAALRGGAEEGIDEGLADLKPVIAPAWNPRPWVLAALVLVVAVAVAVFLWRRRHRPAPLEPVLAPEELARLALAALLRPARLAEEDPGPFAFEVSGILRRYLEARFGFLAWRMTTAELLRAMPHELAEQRKVEAAIRDVLEASDRVKFAREAVTEAELRRWVAQVSEVVAVTTPMEPTP